MTLALFAAPHADFADYHGAVNRAACCAVEAWAVGEGHWCIGLWGDEGVGKSHLLQAAVRRAHERGASTMYVPLREILPLGPGVLEDLEHLHAVAIDDLDVIAGQDDWEEAVFNFYNRCAAAGGRLAFACRRPPMHSGYALPDLRSRLSAALGFALSDLDDLEKQAALRARAHARGLDLSEPVAAFLLRRLPRRMPELVAAIDALDQASLRDRRPLTVPYVREILGFSATDS
jgi:DnaA family protein